MTQIGELLAPISEVAAANPHAWFPQRAHGRGAEHADAREPHGRLPVHEVRGVGHGRRHGRRRSIVCQPRTADELGVPADRRVYLRGWCYATDPDLPRRAPRPRARRRRWRPPARRHCARAGWSIDDVAHLDLYSCFASSVHLACDALGIAPDDSRGLTVTGGLPFSGGAGSNYMLHSIATMVDVLRRDPGSTRDGHRRRHAHDQARLRPVLHGAAAGRPRRSAGPARRAGGPRRARLRSTIADRHEGPAHGGVVHSGPRPRRRTRVGSRDRRRGGRRRAYGRVEDTALLADLEAREWVGRPCSSSPARAMQSGAGVEGVGGPMEIREAVIVDVVRTAFGKRKGALAGWHPCDLLGFTLKSLVERTGLDPELLDDVVTGCVTQSGEQGCNIGRNAVIAGGLPFTTPATSVDRQCGSSQQAMHFVAASVMSGMYDLAIACGVESMSRAPMASNARGGSGPFSPAYLEAIDGQLWAQFRVAQVLADKWGITPRGDGRVRRAEPPARRCGDGQRPLRPRDPAGSDQGRGRQPHGGDAEQRRGHPRRRRLEKVAALGARAVVGAGDGARHHSRQRVPDDRRRVRHAHRRPLYGRATRPARPGAACSTSRSRPRIPCSCSRPPTLQRASCYERSGDVDQRLRLGRMQRGVRRHRPHVGARVQARARAAQPARRARSRSDIRSARPACA